MVKRLSLFQTLQFALLFLIPNYTQGLFTRRRFWVSFWNLLNVDRRAIRFISRLRRRHGAKRFSTRIGRTETVIVLDPAEIREVLANSPNRYVSAESKYVGMSHFQPNAVTISRGEEWKDRRRFNERVLNTGHSHEYANRFLEVTVNATAAMRSSAGARLEWQHFDGLFESIAAGVIFGSGAGDAHSMFDRLGRMMREGNRVFGLKKSAHFDAFYNEVWAQLRAPKSESLAAISASTPHTDATRIANQVPHWMFAIRDTLPINTVRALALISSHPNHERRVRDELVWSEKLTPEIVDGLGYLGGCVHEAMRLWPTTPFIARQTLDGSQQVLILNTFNHRDAETNLTANSFYPEQWIGRTPELPFNHLSSGTQVCAGKDLALFLAKAVLATLLDDHRFELRNPSLSPAKPLPEMFNHFNVSFEKRT